MPPRLIVITGPMFCGKSEELIRRLHRHGYARHQILAVKPKLDDRQGSIRSRKFVDEGSVTVEEFPAFEIGSQQELRSLLREHHPDVLFDPSGAILMDSDGDELEQEPEEGDSNDDHEDLKILLAVDGDEEVIPQEESPFIPSVSHMPVSSPTVEAEVVRRQLSLWRGKKQLNQAVRDMCEIIRELMLDRDDFDNGTDIANFFYEEGSKSFEYDPQVSFKKLEALVRFSLKQMIARKEVGRDWEEFLVLADHNPEH